ncbi:MAG: glycoside hydrolase family 43 protein [Acidimicrobiales bacterium]
MLVAALTVASAAGPAPGAAGAQERHAALAESFGTGPVYGGVFADPTVLAVGGTYYAYATNADGENLPVIESTDLDHWVAVGDAMPVLPSWVQDGFTWSPSVAVDPTGGYELFFTAYDPAAHHECLGRATASSPLGPFVSSGEQPFLCQTALGGTIDPSVYAGRGADDLVWKSDGETGQGQEVWSQRLGPGDRTLVGRPALLQAPDQAWEAGVIEGPTLAAIGGTLYLLFSGNAWTSAAYAIGAATCASPLGPCAPSGPVPVLSTSVTAVGPGGPAVFRAGRRTVLAYAASPGGAPSGGDGTGGGAGGGEGGRELFLADVSSAGGTLLVDH